MFKFVTAFVAALGVTLVSAQPNSLETPGAPSAIDYDGLARQRTYLGGLDEEDLKVQEPLPTPVPPVPFDTGVGSGGADDATTGGEEEPSEDPGL